MAMLKRMQGARVDPPDDQPKYPLSRCLKLISLVKDRLKPQDLPLQSRHMSLRFNQRRAQTQEDERRTKQHQGAELRTSSKAKNLRLPPIRDRQLIDSRATIELGRPPTVNDSIFGLAQQLFQQSAVNPERTQEQLLQQLVNSCPLFCIAGDQLGLQLLTAAQMSVAGEGRVVIRKGSSIAYMLMVLSGCLQNKETGEVRVRAGQVFGQEIVFGGMMDCPEAQETLAAGRQTALLKVEQLQLFNFFGEARRWDESIYQRMRRWLQSSLRGKELNRRKRYE